MDWERELYNAKLEVLARAFKKLDVPNPNLCNGKREKQCATCLNFKSAISYLKGQLAELAREISIEYAQHR